MGRQLSTDPEKRRLQLFRNMYMNYHCWRAEVERSNLLFLNVDGEEIYFYDLLVGLDDLPARQREAFELHLLLGMTEKEAAERMGFLREEYTFTVATDGTTTFEIEVVGWVTLVGQYSTQALKRMMVSYDEHNSCPVAAAV